jgi:hypothetical protein
MRDWFKFLAAEKDAAWRAEGRERLEDLKKRLATHGGTSWLPPNALREAVAFWTRELPGGTPGGAASPPAEAYLPRALTQ